MENLIKALNIFLKYGNPDYPTRCENNTLYINIDPELVSNEDIIKLGKYGFIPDKGDEGFISFHYGYCL